MSVILVTGQPGSGKTALVVDMLAHDEQFKGRPLFTMGIPELTIDHQECPAVSEWTEFRQAPEDESINLAYFRFPEGALVVIDEAQRVYRPRPVGSKVPPEVAAFETHRHTGVDFILLTQHPNLIDSNIRKLIGRHIHIRVTPMGRKKYEWTELGDPESVSSREIAARENYKLPSRAFKLYKSSQLHTKIRVKIPWFVYLFGFCVVALIAGGWYAYNRIASKSKLADTGPLQHAVGKPTESATSQKMSLPEYLEASVPRIQGLHHTAPKYDSITQPTDAPYPVGCISTSNKCRCVDQQGSDYQTTDDICRQIVAHGMFKDFGSVQREPAQATPTPAQPGAGMAGGVARPSLNLPTTAPNEPPFVGSVS